MGFLPISAAASIYLFKPPYDIGSVPSLSGHAIAVSVDTVAEGGWRFMGAWKKEEIARLDFAKIREKTRLGKLFTYTKRRT